jgi:hypothetical protein
MIRDKDLNTVLCICAFAVCKNHLSSRLQIWCVASGKFNSLFLYFQIIFRRNRSCLAIQLILVLILTSELNGNPLIIPDPMPGIRSFTNLFEESLLDPTHDYQGTSTNVTLIDSIKLQIIKLFFVIN